MAEQERIIEYVFRVKTNGDRVELDDTMEAAQYLNVGLVNRRDDGTEFWMEYIPEGSHWRDVTPQLSKGTSAAYPHGLPWDPEAAALPGGNTLSPPQPLREDQ